MRSIFRLLVVSLFADCELDLLAESVVYPALVYPALIDDVRKKSDGEVLVTDGPYTETKEHMGGFWILECVKMDEALTWARRGAIFSEAVGEVHEAGR